MKMIIPLKHTKKGEGTHSSNMKNIRTHLTCTYKKHLNQSDMKSQNRVKVFPFTFFFWCYCWCHGNLNFTLIISDTRAYDFQNEIANSQKKSKIVEEIFFVSSLWCSTTAERSEEKKFQLTILRLCCVVSAMTMQWRKLQTPLCGSKTNNWYVSILDTKFTRNLSHQIKMTQ